MSDVVFVIPARGGSKGIPHKNLKMFNGKPLIAWSIIAAKQTGLGDIIVTSDSQDILDIAKKYGAIGIKRPKKISDDKSCSEDAINHALRKHYGKKKMPRITFFLQCTSPWITSQDIAFAHIEFVLGNFDSMALVKPCHLYTGTAKLLEFKRDQKTRLMRQDMKKKVAEVGAYLFKTTRFINCNKRYFGLVGCSIIHRELPPEIDSPMDWEINEKYFEYWIGNKHL